MEQRLNTRVDWCDELFKAFHRIYADQYERKWANCDMQEVKKDWVRGLRQFGLPTIRLALNYCRENETIKYPPNLPEFIGLCKQHIVRPELLTLPYKRQYTQEVANNNLLKIKEILSRKVVSHE